MASPKWRSLGQSAARGDYFHIVDTETTGTSPPQCRVIEVACVTLCHGKEVGRFETLVDPGVPVPPFITQLTGIRPAMLAGAPDPQEAYARFSNYLAAFPGHFVAHNANFDYRFLDFEFKRIGLSWPFADRFCTVSLSRHCLPRLRRHSLDSLIQHFGIAISGDRHRAMADVEATATAFVRMVAMLAEEAHDQAKVSGPDGAPGLAMPVNARLAPGTGMGRLPDGAWRSVLHAIKAQSVTLAAMLEQHGALIDLEADGSVAIALHPTFLPRIDMPRLALLEAAVAEVFGQPHPVRLQGHMPQSP